MNKKLIAAAVSAAVVAPVASYGDTTVYGRINNALDFKDVDGDGGGADSTLNMRNVSSRFGIKASSELGNGLTASARYEFSTFTDREGVEGGHGGVNDTRIGTVGISGGFGSITAGNQWSAFYDTVGTHMDPTYSLGYYLYSSAIGGPYRGSNTIKYANSFGPVSLELDVRVQETPEQNAEKIGFEDGIGIGASWAATDALTLAAAFDSQDSTAGADTDRTGVAAKYNIGDGYFSLSWQETDEDGGATRDATYLWGGYNLTEKTFGMLGWGSGDLDNGQEPDQLTLGIYHNMGGGLRLYFEGTTYDADGSANDFDQALFGMRIDF